MAARARTSSTPVRPARIRWSCWARASNDTLRGGKRGGDFLDGGAGSDRIFAEDGQIDTVRGGKGVGTDHATVDFNPHDDVADVANVD